jgi:hypothetical protein
LKHRPDVFLNNVCRGRAEIQRGNEALLQRVYSIGPDKFLHGPEVVERLGDPARADVAKFLSFSHGQESGGELADKGMQADVIFLQLFDESDLVQSSESLLQRNRMSGSAETRYSGE